MASYIDGIDGGKVLISEELFVYTAGRSKGVVCSEVMAALGCLF